MNKIILGLIAILVTVSCKNRENNKENNAGFTINGYVENLNSTKVYLYNTTNKLIDSAIISNSKFQFTGTSNTTKFTTILFKKDSISVDALLENTDFQLYASKKQQLFFGGKSQQVYNNYLEGLRALEKSKLDLFSSSINNTTISNQLKDLNSKIYTYKITYLKNAPFTPIKTKIINNLLINSILTIDNLLKIKTITATFNDANITAMVNTKLENLKAIVLKQEQKAIKKVKIPNRQLAPMFTGEGLNGSNLALANVLKGKKAILIDFWASWCEPCRQVTPQVKAIYNKYKNKGFDIITVSEDRNKNAWKNGLKEDKMLSWNHIYDDNMRIAYMFNVSSIPHMVLLDGNGGIINRKISVYRLENELQKILN